MFLWLVCGAAGAFATWRHEGMVAVGLERIGLPLIVFVVHVVGWLFLEVQRRLVRRYVPVWSALMAVVPPALLLALVWVPGVRVRVALPADLPKVPATGPNVVLVTLDSFRADHLGALGGRELTPNLDALAAEGLLYSQAVTTAPLSGPAHASMLTGLGVLEHGLASNGAAVKVPTVVDAVRERGYRTGAFVSAQVLDRDSGLHVGFTHYDDRWGAVQRLDWLPAVAELGLRASAPRRSGNETVDRALEWLGSEPSPAFAWIHLYDAHGPYAPPMEFQPAAEALDQARTMDREDLRRRGDVQMIGDRKRTRVREQTLLYAASVRWVDALVGRIAKQVPPDTVLIVVGDHGESLGEHDYFFSHGGAVWEEAIHVPFIVRWPGRFAPGERFDGLTSVVAVHQLVREATGLSPVAPLRPEGSVLVYTTGQDAGRVDEEVGLRDRNPPAACVRREGSKVSRRGSEAPEYFALAVDPGELSPLPVPAEFGNDVQVLEQVLAQPVPRLNDAQRARLEALGYRE